MTRIAAIQLNSGAEVGANLSAITTLLDAAAAAGARLAVLPENAFIMPASSAARQAAAEQPGDGPVQRWLAASARRLGLWIVAGTLPLAGTEPPRLRAASLVYDPDGQCVARYDKIHLFDVDLGGDESYRESAAFEPGADIVVLDTGFARLGLSVCYDLRFPELYRQLATCGAELITAPSAFTMPTGAAHWELLTRTRAVENLVYLIAPAQWGRHDNGRRTYGETLIVGPWGSVLARRAAGAGVVIADFDRDEIGRCRARLPALSHRRLS